MVRCLPGSRVFKGVWVGRLDEVLVVVLTGEGLGAVLAEDVLVVVLADEVLVVILT